VRARSRRSRCVLRASTAKAISIGVERSAYHAALFTPSTLSAAQLDIVRIEIPAGQHDEILCDPQT